MEIGSFRIMKHFLHVYCHFAFRIAEFLVRQALKQVFFAVYKCLFGIYLQFRYIVVSSNMFFFFNLARMRLFFRRIEIALGIIK